MQLYATADLVETLDVASGLCNGRKLKINFCYTLVIMSFIFYTILSTGSEVFVGDNSIPLHLEASLYICINDLCYLLLPAISLPKSAIISIFYSVLLK